MSKRADSDESRIFAGATTVTITLRETRTSFVFEMPQMTEDAETPQGQGVRSENENYEYATVGAGSSVRKLIDAETQTIRLSTKSRGTFLGTEPRRNKGTLVNNWVMYDARAGTVPETERTTRRRIRREAEVRVCTYVPIIYRRDSKFPSRDFCFSSLGAGTPVQAARARGDRRRREPGATAVSHLPANAFSRRGERDGAHHRQQCVRGGAETVHRSDPARPVRAGLAVRLSARTLVDARVRGGARSSGHVVSLESGKRERSRRRSRRPTYLRLGRTGARLVRQESESARSPVRLCQSGLERRLEPESTESAGCRPLRRRHQSPRR